MTTFYKKMEELSQNGYAEIAKATGVNDFSTLCEIANLLNDAYRCGIQDGRMLEVADGLEKERQVSAAK